VNRRRLVSGQYAAGKRLLATVSDMPRHRRRFAALPSLVLVALGVQSVFASQAVVPEPRELRLTAGERQLAVAGMRPGERAVLAAEFGDSRILVAAYTRRLFTLDHHVDGSVTVEPVGINRKPPGSNLDIPALETAGPGGYYDLYISVSVTRSRNCCPYEWRITNYFDWRGRDGMQCCNAEPDRVGSSWAGDLSLQADKYSGVYTGSGQSIDIWRSDVTPNEGVGWSFREHLNSWGTQHANYGHFFAWIREPKWKGLTANVGMKYFHTTGGTTGFSLSFLNAGISISPTSNQVSAAAYANFSH
jgi:hypothetical protein